MSNDHLVNCSYCNSRISIEAYSCPHCARPGPGKGKIPNRLIPISMSGDSKAQNKNPTQCSCCNGEISKKTLGCPRCGHPTKRQIESQKRLMHQAANNPDTVWGATSGLGLKFER